MASWDGTRWIADRPAHPQVDRAKRTADWIATLLMMLLVPALLIGAAGGVVAAKPGSGATLTVIPNAAPAWGWATASGCGYSSSVVYLDIEKPEALAFTGTMPDAGGCFSITFSTDGPGMYHLQTRQEGNGKHWWVMASYDLPVQ